MSKYTTEVRFICETFAGLSESVGFNSINEVLEKCNNQVIGNYPIFDEDYRSILNIKILKHYYTREICEETVGLWQLRLNTLMNEIMPYYNKLYESELLKFNPFYNIDITSSHIKNNDTSSNFNSETSGDKSINENQKGTTNINNENKSNTSNSITANATANSDKKQSDKYSDTPQGGINGVENGTYLTNARIIQADENSNSNSSQESQQIAKNSMNENNTTSKSFNSIENNNFTKKDNNNINTTEDYLQHVQGKQGGLSYSKLIKEYRESFINIDLLIINELNILFFGLWE